LKKSFNDEEKQYAKDLAKTLDYLPLALELAAAQVEEDKIPMNILAKELKSEYSRLKILDRYETEELNEENERKLSLKAFFYLSLTRLSKEKLGAFCWLGVLPENIEINPEMASTLWNLSNIRDASNTLNYLKRKSLLLPKPSKLNDLPTFHIHSLLHEIARYLLESSPENNGDIPGIGIQMEKAHAKVLERYKLKTENGLWHTLPDDGYIYDYLTWHMEKAGCDTEIHALLCEETESKKNAWYEKREYLGQTAGFIEDIARAWRLAENQSKNNSNKCEIIPSISLEIRYALIITSINSLSANISPSLIAALAENHIWHPIQGLSYSRQIPSKKQKFHALALITPKLPDSIKGLALSETLEIAKSFDDINEKVKALICIAPEFSEYKKEEILDEAFETIKRTKNINGNVVALALMISEANSKNMLEELLKLSRKIENLYFKTILLTEIAFKLSRIQKNDILSEARQTANEIYSKDYHAKALIRIANKLEGSFRNELLDEAKNVAKDIPIKKDFANVMIDIAFELSDSHKSKMISELLNLVREFDDEGYKAELLLKIAMKFDNPLKEEILKETTNVARNINDKVVSTDVLISIAFESSKPKQNEIIKKVLENIRESNDELWKKAMISKIVTKLRGPLLIELLEISRKIDDVFWKADLLLSIISPIKDNDIDVLFSEQKKRVSRVLYINGLTMSLEKSVFDHTKKIPEGIKEKALKEATRIICKKAVNEIVFEGNKIIPKNIFSKYKKTLRSSDIHLSTKEIKDLFSQVMEVEKISPEKIPSLCSKSKILMDKMKFKELKVEDITNEGDSIKSDEKNYNDYSELEKDVLKLAKEIEDEYERANAIGLLIKYTEDLSPNNLYTLWRNALSIFKTRKRKDLYIDIAAFLPIIYKLGGEKAIEETYYAVEEVSRWWS